MAAITLTQTTLSAAAGRTANVLTVASATGISAPVANFRQQLYVVNPGQSTGELVDVIGVSGTSIQVSRLGEYKQHFISGAFVLIGPVPTIGTGNPGYGGLFFTGGFQVTDPYGGNSSQFSTASGGVLVTPWVNVITGQQWIFSTVLNCWVPGWNNPNQAQVTTLVASAAGLVTPSGPLFHINGTSAITGFNVPVGFTGRGSFTVIPDAGFTWTAANNIAVLGTAVTDIALVFQYDQNAALWYPSYVAA